MTLVDTNILIYATFADAPEHAGARRWLEAELSADDGSVELCGPVVYAFVRLATSSRVFGEHALAVEAGWGTASGFLEQASVRVVAPGAHHARIAAELAGTPGLRSEDVPDIEIAALAIEHGLVLGTHDSGFRRFPALRTIDPLA